MNKRILCLVLGLMLLTVLLGGCKKPAWQEDDLAAQTYGCLVYREQGCAKMVFASGSELEIQSGATADYQEGAAYALPAADKVLIDGDTTNQTQTAGALDVNVGTITADVSAVNVALTQDDGVTSGEDALGMVMTLTGNDANGDVFGIKLTAAATSNAAAGTYEYLIGLDCAENTAGACPDAILVTSTGANTAVTDGVDVSADNIVNAVNVGSNLVLGGNSDYFTIGATDASFIVTRNDAGSVTFMGADNSSPAETIYDTTGTGTVVVGSADVTAITLTTDGTGTAEVVLPTGAIGGTEIDDDTVDGVDIADIVALDATTIGIKNGSTGSVVFNFHDYADTTDDDMAHIALTANCTDTGAGTEDCDFTVGVVEAGAAAETRLNFDADAGITIGSANNASVTLTTDGTGDAEVTLPAGSVATAEITDDTITFANISDSSAVDADTTFTMADGIELVITATHTTGDTEAILVDIDQADDGANTDDVYALLIAATSESGDAGDTFRAIGINWEEGTANTVMDAAIAIDNLETTAATMTDAIIVTSSGVADGVTDALDASAANILNAINLGDNDVAVGTQFNLKNSGTGSVIANFRDYADTATDDMAHAAITANCTDTGNGTEDCDLTIGVVEAGAAAETRLSIDADGGIIVGAANNNSVTLTTDGTGTAEVVLPAGSVDTDEVLDDTLTFADISDSSAVDVDTTFTMADGIELVITATHTSGDTEILLIDVDQVDDGVNTDDVIAFKIEATSESGDIGDTIRGIVIGYEEGTANTIMDAAISIDNAETTAATMTDAIVVTSSGVAAGVTDAIDVSAANILNALNVGSNLCLGGNSDYFTIGAADATFAVTRNDSGAVTFLGADDAGAADTVYDTTGAGAITVGSVDVTAVTITTDGTGDAEVVVSENSIGPDEVAVMHDWVIACGEADENGTIYYGPATALFGGEAITYTIGSANCDALDNATEATADAPLFTNVAFKITGLYCKQSGTLGAGEAVTFTMRSATAGITPAISCIISAGETDCRSLTGSTTDIAAGATIAVQAVQNGDNADDDHWCKVYIAYK